MQYYMKYFMVESYNHDARHDLILSSYIRSDFRPSRPLISRDPRAELT